MLALELAESIFPHLGIGISSTMYDLIAYTALTVYSHGLDEAIMIAIGLGLPEKYH